MEVKTTNIDDICSKGNDKKVRGSNGNGRPSYPQPHNIHINGEDINGALKHNMRMKLHGLLKYIEKYKRSKQERRLYD